jgi:late competence protein required for DNA uptake (superfamily II DNA/RNA helicase)
VQHWLQKGRLPASFIQRLRVSIQRGAQVFLFVTRISHIQGLVELLIKQLPDVPIAGTSSQDEERTAKVRLFRATEIRVLVTTTILERGVTVPRSDVYVLDADSSLFDEASLVQMAGRAGRSKDDPCGGVIFTSPQWTRGQKRAIRQIKRMNALARKKGYLKELKH